MTIPLSVCTRGAACSDMIFYGLKVDQGQKSIADFQHNMGTVRYCSGVCTIGLPCSKMVTQASLMMNDQDARARPQQKETLNESAPRFWITDGRLVMKWHNI